MESIWLEILVSFGPLLLFVVAMVIIWYRGNKQNTKILDTLEENIMDAVRKNGYSAEKVKIRPDEYEYRCKSKNKRVRILTINLKLANRSFIVQWLINLLMKEKEKLFIGSKFRGEFGDEDPAYKFDMVPYRRGRYISQRFDYFIEMEEMKTVNKDVDKLYMIKSQSQAHAQHLVENQRLMSLFKKNVGAVEHFSFQHAKESTDPHFSVNFQFLGTKNPPVKEYLEIFFLSLNLHIQHNDDVKKLAVKKIKSYDDGRGKARRGAGRGKKQTKPARKKTSKKSKKQTKK